MRIGARQTRDAQEVKERVQVYVKLADDPRSFLATTLVADAFGALIFSDGVFIEQAGRQKTIALQHARLLDREPDPCGRDRNCGKLRTMVNRYKNKSPL